MTACSRMASMEAGELSTSPLVEDTCVSSAALKGVGSRGLVRPMVVVMVSAVDA